MRVGGMKLLGPWQYGLVVSFVVLMSAPLATAQDAEQADAPEVDEIPQPLDLEELRVVGSRPPGRSAADSPVPVDIIDGDSFKHYGVRDLNSLLAATIPSYNTVTNSGGDKNSLIRPAKLRGLPPDATLVLVNGKRRHRGSGITDWPDSRSKGAHGVDIASIPAIALKRVEVLRAGAQYGSDAVAGVMNFVLRDDREGGTLEARWGQHYHGDGDPNSWYRNDALARQGFAIGTNGSPGTRPADAGSASRDIFAAYLDFDANLVRQVLLTASGRYENHEGVGDSLDGKVAARWNLIEYVLAMRASIRTSFRTPTIGQASYRKTISAIDPNTGRLADSAIVTPDSAIAQAFGAKPLKPETATSFGLGAVLTLGDLSVTADYYNIEYRNRVSLSNALSVSNLDQMTRDAFATISSVWRPSNFSTTTWT